METKNNKQKIEYTYKITKNKNDIYVKKQAEQISKSLI